MADALLERMKSFGYSGSTAAPAQAPPQAPSPAPTRDPILERMQSFRTPAAQPAPKADSVYGYKVRPPVPGEDEYFKKNPDVAGMATDDGMITLNPYSTNTPEQQQAVAKNEAARLFMEENQFEAPPVTQAQKDFFKGTEYAKPENEKYLRQTIIGRILSGDASAGETTPEQRAAAKAIQDSLNKRDPLLREKADPSKMPTEQQLYEQELQKQLQARSGGMMDYLPGPLKDVASAAAGYASDMAGVGLRGSAAAENLVRGLIPDKLEGAAGFALKAALPGVGHAVTAMGSEEMSRKKLDLANDLQKTSEAFDQAVDKARGDGVIGWARKMGTGALRSGANMLTGAALGGPAGAIALGGATEASQTYGELEQAGASEASQVGWAAAAGVWESTVGGIMQKLGLGGAEKLLKEAGVGALKQLWKMPLKEAVKEVAKAQGQEIVEEEITELGHLGMRYANGMQQYVSPEETIKDILTTVRDTAAQTAIMTGGVQAGTQAASRTAEKRDGATPFGPGQTPPVPPQTPPAAPVTPQTPPPRPRGGLNPPTTPRPIPREELEAIRAKGPVSRKDGQKIGLTPEQMDNQETRTKAVDQLIEDVKKATPFAGTVEEHMKAAEAAILRGDTATFDSEMEIARALKKQAQEQQNAGSLLENKGVPEEAGRPVQGSEVPSGGNLRGTGQVEGGAKPAGEVTPAQEVQVAPKVGDTRKDELGVEQVFRMVDPNTVGFTEPTKDVENSKEVEEYTRLAKEGSVPPPVDIVWNEDSGKPVTTNRRRVMAAQRAGTLVPAWVDKKADENLFPTKPTPPAPTPVEAPKTDIQRAMEEEVRKALAPKPVKEQGRKPSKEAEAIAERAAKGEQVERPADVSEARWKAMVAQKAKRLGKKAPVKEDVAQKTLMQELKDKQLFGIADKLERGEVTEEEARNWMEGKWRPEEKKQAERNPADAASEMKGRGVGRQESWSRWVQMTQLQPGMDAKEWYSIYDSVTATEPPSTTPNTTKPPKRAPRKPKVQTVSQAVEAIASRPEQEKRGTVEEAPKSEASRIADKLVAWKGTERLTDPENFSSSWMGYDESQQKAVVDELVARGELPISFSRIKTGKKSRGYLTSQELLQGLTRKNAADKFKKPARQPSERTKAKKAALDKAAKEFRDAAKTELGGTLPGAVNARLVKAAGSLIKAAVEYKYSQFKDFVDYVVKLVGEKKTVQLADYLEAAWAALRTNEGFTHLDEPSSIKDMLKKPVKKSAPKAAPKAEPAPKSNWQDSVLSALSGKTKVADAVELPTLWAQIEKANPGMTMEEFKQGLLKLYEDGKIKLEDATGEWATIIDNPLAIRGKDFDEKRGYGLKWWVRGVEGTQPVESPVKNPVPPPVKEAAPKVSGTVGTKNVKTDELRDKIGLPPRDLPERESVNEMDAEAARRMKADPELAGRLAEELTTTPRAVSEVEDFILKRHINDLKNQRNAGKDVDAAFLTAIEASELVGTIWGRMGVARQVEMNADFSLEGLIRKHFKTVGEAPSKEMLAKLEEMAKRIEQQDAEIAELRKRKTEEEIDALIEEALKNVRKPAPKEKIGTKKDRIRKQISEGVSAFKTAWNEAVKAAGGKSFLSGVPLTPETIAALGRAAKAAAGLIKSYAELGVESFLELTARIKQDIGDITAEQTKIFREEWDKLFAKVESPMGPTPTDPMIGATARQLTRYAVEAGITDREQVIDIVHQQLTDWGVEQTRSETMRAMSGYGDFRELPGDVVSTTVRGIKGEIQQLLKLEAMQAGQAPEKTGVERREPTEAERQLIKQVNEAKKKGGYTVTDPKRQLKSALDTAKTTVENAIKDTDLAIEALEKAIDDRVPLAKPEGRTPGPTDAKLEEMKAKLAEKRAQRKALRAEYDTIFPPKRGAMSDANRLKMAERLITRLNDQLEADLAAGNIMGKEQKDPLTSPILEQQRARREELKAALKAAREGSPEYQAQLQAKEDARYLKDLQRQEAFWNKRAEDAKQGILPTPKPKKTRTNKEIVDKLIERDKAKRKALAEIEAEKRRRWDLGQKIYAGLSEVATALPRELMAGLENSVVLRQGWFFTMQAPFHPIIVFSRILDGLQSIFSERIAMASQEKLSQRPNAAEYEQAGIEMTQEFGPLNKVDELYQSRIVDWLASTENILWFPARWAAKAYIGTARGFRTFSNGMKADLYDLLKHDTMQARRFFNKYGMAKVPEWTESDTKLTGRSANIFAGRGTGLKEGGILNYLLWAPKWAWSRVQAEFLLPLQMATPQFLSRWNSDPAIRLAHARLYVQAAVGAATHLAALYFTLALLAGDDEDKKPKIEFDTTSTDLWKLKMGDTRIDVMGGLQQYLVFFSRLWHGTKKLPSGEVVALRGEEANPFKGDMWDEITKQARYKFGPTFSGIIDFITQKTAVGEQLPDNVFKRTGSIVARRLVPMTWPDIFEAEKSLGLKQGTVAAIEAFMGASVNTYGDYTKYRDGTPDEQKEQFGKALEKMTWDSPDLPYMDLLTKEQKEQVAKQKELRAGELVFEALRESPDERVAAAAKDKKKSPYKDAESLQKAQEAFQKDQASFAALKAQASLEEAERLLAVRYAEEMGTQPIQSDGQWLPSGSASKNAAFKERRKALRKAYQGK